MEYIVRAAIATENKEGFQIVKIPENCTPVGYEHANGKSVVHYVEEYRP